MHLVTGGGEKQLAGMMMQAEADLDELILAYSQVSCSPFDSYTGHCLVRVIAFSDNGQQQICACLGRMPSSWS